MTIYLVRHGQAQAGVEELDPGLTPLGHEQARAAAAALREALGGRVVVSPLRRTLETAVPIAEALACSPVTRIEVAEVFDPSMPAEQRRNMIGPFMASRWSDQGDTLRAWRERVVTTLRELGGEAADAGHDLVVVSHYIAIGAAIGEAIGDDRVVPAPIANASITRIAIAGARLELVEAASTAHLAPEQVTGLTSATAGRA